ncbi:hypothetical protein HMPREF0201_01401 [Cedecea davisae DSM 4568]|uniref:Uncharacterized protein n=1 Tax=Cedecea davisae DSM 4568 TaxID=566551 RepID=S3JCV0_9ENTR|nr:hypothetical protein HMPREF0201_01401 [Cedecea davisae DSM 4568]
MLTRSATYHFQEKIRNISLASALKSTRRRTPGLNFLRNFVSADIIIAEPLRNN